MGAKQSKGGKVAQNGQTETAENSEGLDTFNKTSTLPATFRNGKEDDVTKTGTLPREGVANLESLTVHCGDGPGDGTTHPPLPGCRVPATEAWLVPGLCLDCAWFVLRLCLGRASLGLLCLGCGWVVPAL